MQLMPPCTSSAHSVSSAAASPLLRRSVTARREGGARRNRQDHASSSPTAAKRQDGLHRPSQSCAAFPGSGTYRLFRPFFLLQRVAKLRLESPVFSQRPQQRIAWPLLLQENALFWLCPCRRTYAVFYVSRWCGCVIRSLHFGRGRPGTRNQARYRQSKRSRLLRLLPH